MNIKEVPKYTATQSLVKPAIGDLTKSKHVITKEEIAKFEKKATKASLRAELSKVVVSRYRNCDILRLQPVDEQPFYFYIIEDKVTETTVVTQPPSYREVVGDQILLYVVTEEDVKAQVVHISPFKYDNTRTVFIRFEREEAVYFVSVVIGNGYQTPKMCKVLNVYEYVIQQVVRFAK